VRNKVLGVYYYVFLGFIRGVCCLDGLCPSLLYAALTGLYIEFISK